MCLCQMLVVQMRGIADGYRVMARYVQIRKLLILGTHSIYMHTCPAHCAGTIVYRISKGGIQSGTLSQENRGAVKAARTLSGNNEE